MDSGPGTRTRARCIVSAVADDLVLCSQPDDTPPSAWQLSPGPKQWGPVCHQANLALSPSRMAEQLPLSHQDYSGFQSGYSTPTALSSAPRPKHWQHDEQQAGFPSSPPGMSETLPSTRNAHPGFQDTYPASTAVLQSSPCPKRWRQDPQQTAWPVPASGILEQLPSLPEVTLSGPDADASSPGVPEQLLSLGDFDPDLLDVCFTPPQRPTSTAASSAGPPTAYSIAEQWSYEEPPPTGPSSSPPTAPQQFRFVVIEARMMRRFLWDCRHFPSEQRSVDYIGKKLKEETRRQLGS